MQDIANNYTDNNTKKEASVPPSTDSIPSWAYEAVGRQMRDYSNTISSIIEQKQNEVCKLTEGVKAIKMER